MEHTILVIDENITHPIDLVEVVAAKMGGECIRKSDDELKVNIEGHWRKYQLIVCLSEDHEYLEFRVGFDMKLSNADPKELLEAVNLANQYCRMGCFTLHREEDIFIFGCTQMLGGDDRIATLNHAHKMIVTCLDKCEHFYPAFQIVAYGCSDADTAINKTMIRPITSC